MPKRGEEDMRGRDGDRKRGSGQGKEESERKGEIHVSGPLLLYSSVIEKEYEEMYVYTRLKRCMCI